ASTLSIVWLRGTRGVPWADYISPYTLVVEPSARHRAAWLLITISPALQRGRLPAIHPVFTRYLRSEGAIEITLESLAALEQLIAHLVRATGSDNRLRGARNLDHLAADLRVVAETHRCGHCIGRGVVAFDLCVGRVLCGERVGRPLQSVTLAPTQGGRSFLPPLHVATQFGLYHPAFAGPACSL